MNKDQLKKIRKELDKCQCCGKDVGFGLNYMRGIGDTKTSRACDDCKDEYFGKVKSEYFVEEYKGNEIYKWNDLFFPYWDAGYAFNTLEECKSRIDDSTSAVVNMGMYHFASSLER